MGAGSVSTRFCERIAQKNTIFSGSEGPSMARLGISIELDHNHVAVDPRTSTGAGCFVLYHANLACAVYMIAKL